MQYPQDYQNEPLHVNHHPHNHLLHYWHSHFRVRQMWKRFLLELLFLYNDFHGHRNRNHIHLLFRHIRDFLQKHPVMLPPDGLFFLLHLPTPFYWETKSLTTLYVFCGVPSKQGWADGVGKRARLEAPFQGVFVKNPEYAGKVDEYDFYFCDRGNHCIRKVTPEGIVSTFAGRGSVSANNAVNGYVDGDLREEARFDNPEGIAYDALNDIFYIGDTGNHRVRKIAWED